MNQTDSEVPALPPRFPDPETEVTYKNLALVNQVPKKSDKPSRTLPQEVLGLISRYKEMFLFDKPVIFDGKDLSATLSSVEITMQQTVGSLISSAVSSFPK